MTFVEHGLAGAAQAANGIVLVLKFDGVLCHIAVYTGQSAESDSAGAPVPYLLRCYPYPWKGDPAMGPVRGIAVGRSARLPA